MSPRLSDRRRLWRSGSAVDHALHLLGVALALHLDSGRGVVEFGDVVWGEGEVGGAEVLLRGPLQRAGARDWGDPGLLREQPGERDLSGGRSQPLADAADEVD